MARAGVWRLMVALLVGVSAGAGGVQAGEIDGLPGEARFVEVGPLPGATVAHGGVALGDGRALVVGGYGRLFGRIPLAGTFARVYEPGDRQWRPLEASLEYGRVGPVVVRAGADVLVIGGQQQDQRGSRFIERFDPVCETFEIVGTLQERRYRPEVTVLLDGRVLVTGESRHGFILERQADGSWQSRPTRGRSTRVRRDHVAVRLANGSVLLAGGRTDRIELFDPNTEDFTESQARLGTVLDDQAGILLYDGRVLLAGGQNVYTNESVAAYWIYDPAADRLDRHEMDWGAPASGEGASRATGASDMIAVDVWAGDPRRRGRWILLAGGEDDPGRGGGDDVVLDVAWVYDAAAGEMVWVGPMSRPHDEFVGIGLSDMGDEARVLIVGGHGPGDSFLAGCEEFVWRWERQR